MNKYYDPDSLYPRLLYIKIGKRRYKEVFKINSNIRKIKVRNKRKFIKRYKIVMIDDFPFIWYGTSKGSDKE